MDVNIITIKFKDGSSIYIDDVSDYVINNNVIKVNKNGYNQFFNFDEVRYIGRTFDLEPEIYDAMKRWDNENKKKHLTYVKRIKLFQSSVMKKVSNGCQMAMRSILFSACLNSMKITYANSMTSTMHRGIRLYLQSVKPSR